MFIKITNVLNDRGHVVAAFSDRSEARVFAVANGYKMVVHDLADDAEDLLDMLLRSGDYEVSVRVTETAEFVKNPGFHWS